MVKFPSFQLSVIIGVLLYDGWLQFQLKTEAVVYILNNI
jgi:hypothetical protein